ncbi:hypothetical protein BKA70DRAFT_1428145 [Coprinopsis sp. MPI-PUGE-AT-0042]|nr:hypothetical protein BKA70DRAFT_1428145 [Coprinopsis sp. MPI-PUGE-AT-0042]
MNYYYDQTKAAHVLDAIMKKRANAKGVGEHLVGIDRDSFNARFAMAKNGTEQVWRVIHKDSTSNGTAECEEVVWLIQGVIAKNELPPFRGNIGRNAAKSKARYLKQGVSLTGFNVPSFSTAVEKIGMVYAEFSRNVGEFDLAPLSLVTLGHEGPSIDVANRYFTSRKDDPYGKALEFGTGIDPSGILTSCLGQDLLYGEDNVVEYYQRTLNKEDGKVSVDAIPPVRFRVGDIVEVQATFSLVPVKGRQWKMVATLRCITLLDGSITQDSMS